MTQANHWAWLAMAACALGVFAEFVQHNHLAGLAAGSAAFVWVGKAWVHEVRAGRIEAARRLAESEA